MANQRGKNQTLVGFWAESSFADKIDSIRGVTPRSQFLREALAEYLQRRNIKVDTREIAAPDRLGKGNAKKKIHYPPHKPSHFELNEGK